MYATTQRVDTWLLQTCRSGDDGWVLSVGKTEGVGWQIWRGIADIEQAQAVGERSEKAQMDGDEFSGGDEDAEKEDMPQAESPQGPAPPLPPPPCSPSAEPQIDFEVGLDAARAAERCRALAARVLRLTDQTGSRSSGRALARSVMLRCGLTSWVNLARDWQ